MKKIDWNNVEEQQEYKRLVAGGYVCKITKIEDVPEKEYLRIEYDIADGEFKGYWEELFTAKGFWGGKFIKSYKESAQKFFKGFLTAIDESNNGFKWDGENEQAFKGKLIGLTLGEEEYSKNDGGTGIRLYVDKCRSIEAIKKGDFIIPGYKYLSGNEPKTLESFTVIGDDDELPF